MAICTYHSLSLYPLLGRLVGWASYDHSRRGYQWSLGLIILTDYISLFFLHIPVVQLIHGPSIRFGGHHESELDDDNGTSFWIRFRLQDFETTGSPTALLASPEIPMGGLGPAGTMGVTVGQAGAMAMAGMPAGMGGAIASQQQQQQQQPYGGVPGLGMLGSQGMSSTGLGM
jgi:hypothetical protein